MKSYRKTEVVNSYIDVIGVIAIFLAGYIASSALGTSWPITSLIVILVYVGYFIIIIRVESSKTEKELVEN